LSDKNQHHDHLGTTKGTIGNTPAPKPPVAPVKVPSNLVQPAGTQTGK